MQAFMRPLTEAETTAVRRFEEQVEVHHRPGDAAHQALSMMLRGDLAGDFVAWLSDGEYRLNYRGRIERVAPGRPGRPIMSIDAGQFL